MTLIGRQKLLIFEQMLDFMFMFEFNRQPQLELADAQAPLPCSEDVWDSSLLDSTAFPDKSGMEIPTGI